MKLSVAAALFGVCLVAVGLAPSSPAHAQQSDGLVERGTTQDDPLRPRNPGLPDDPLATTITRTEATRLGRTRRQSGVVAAVPTDEQAIRTSQSLANSLSLDCKVEHATLRGMNAERQGVYEVGCLEGPGYILAETTPPQAADCVAIAGRAAKLLAADPAAPTGPVCTLPVNQNAQAVVASYARAAGVACEIDQGAWVGESTAGNAIYEVGCAGAGGYWVERVAGAWTATDCVKVVAQNAACGFTTDAERAATLKAWLASSPASGCDVVDARYMGENANGVFYEAKCGSGDGYVARFNQARTVQQVYPCAEAATIGGGCKLAARP